MSLTAIFGEPGVGKSALLTSFIRKIYSEKGNDIMRSCIDRIEEVNEKYKRKLDFPDRIPIFTDYKVKFLIDYEIFYETYFTNGFYCGLPHTEVPTIYVPPFSVIGLSEVQRYYDSRKKSLPSWVSRTFEMHRHYGLEIFLDLQRFYLLDKNIRDNCSCFLEVKTMKHKFNAFGGIVSTEWTCHKWENNVDVERYLSDGKKNYEVVKFNYHGNIFNCYDSYNYKDKFLPDKDDNFSYLTHVDDVSLVSEKLRPLYDFSEPENYR